MDIIRTNYSTLSSFAQEEAPSAPEYPYTDILAAHRGVVEEIMESEHTSTNSSGTSSTRKEDAGSQYSTYTRSFQRILKHFFGDYFLDDADEEIASDMAERWVAFAKSGNPNYEGSKVEWIPWRYIPAGETRESPSFEDYMPWKTRDEYDFWSDVEMSDSEDANSTIANEKFVWSDDKEGRAYRRRALQALSMEVVEEDLLRTELKRSKYNDNDPDNSFFALKFLSNFGMHIQQNTDERIPLHTIRQVQRIAQDMGVLGTGLRGDGRRHSERNYWDDDFFPQLLELKWPPEERLVERDCTCDFWERIRCEFRHRINLRVIV